MMAKIGELNWDELTKSVKEEYKHEPTALWAADMYGGGKEVVDPLNKAEKRLKDGEVPRKPTNEEIAKIIMHGIDRKGIRQATDEELFGHLVVSEEMAKAAQKEWDNKLNAFYEEANKSITSDTANEWNGREPLTKGMTEEELAKWRMYTGE